MAKNYELNYDWHRLGPTQWTEESTVTLQVDADSYDHGEKMWAALSGWWKDMPKEGELAYAGGCRFPAPVRLNDEHATARIISRGQDAFDSIAHYAEELRGILEAADADVVITWTELPHS
ncbi:MAG: hypothetical protein Q4G50_01330 [Corynebacterium sp.]|uniref:hypothetical protein n=1 Tax=Corynebacterium sp. TaxID=1720 RepID=UPI0026DFD702|nr:hypothetical protein [Corynebacterium sp.]MDO5668622.1 hypothetical protein [Corynebacterium sp.]